MGVIAKKKILGPCNSEAKNIFTPQKLRWSGAMKTLLLSTNAPNVVEFK
jgi:hypothetical protein